MEIKITYEDFLKTQSVKHASNIAIGDILYVPSDLTNSSGFYDKVFCTGICGRDEFWGNRFSDNKEVDWCDNTFVKIVGKQINIQANA